MGEYRGSDKVRGYKHCVREVVKEEYKGFMSNGRSFPMTGSPDEQK